jgi:hypothetical protein
VDAQLERAIQEVVSRLKDATPLPAHPAYERRTPPSAGRPGGGER